MHLLMLGQREIVPRAHPCRVVLASCWRARPHTARAASVALGRPSPQRDHTLVAESCENTSRMFTCPSAGCNESLIEEAARHISRRVCRLDGIVFDVQILAEPKGTASSTRFAGMGEQTRSWLAAAQRPGPSRGMSCSQAATAPADAVPLLLADFRTFHIRTLPGALASHGIGTQLVPEMRQRLCAHYTLLGRLLENPHDGATWAPLPRQPPTPRRPAAVAIINYGGEWAGATFVRLTESMLRSCGANPARTVLLHYNLGSILPDELRQEQSAPKEYVERLWSPMLRWFEENGFVGPRADGGASPPRLRQSYWNWYIETTATEVAADAAARKHVQAYAVCNHSTKPLRTRLEASLRRPADASYLLLGGRPSQQRGLAMLELSRRGLLQPGTARWSGGRFPFCVDVAKRRAACNALQPPASVAVAEALCAQLPKVLDVDPGVCTRFGGPHHRNPA